MASETKLVLPLILLIVNCMQHFAYGKPQVPCHFIFGDSQFDSGNNNLLVTSAKANYPPYGIDSPKGATGRFSNNRTIVDIISNNLGFEKFIPTYASLGGLVDNLEGVNYASGAAGILDESGKNLGDNFSMGRQIKNHKTTVSIFGIRLGGSDKAKEYLKKCLYSVNIGSNDYINNYFVNWSPARRDYSPEEFAEILIKKYYQYLQVLYQYGAKKFALYSVGFIGCTPYAIKTAGTNGSCVEEMNTAASMFNDKLKALVDQMNSNVSSGSKSIFINMRTTSLYEGFRVSDAPCCPTRPDGMCAFKRKPCPVRDDYLFMDEFHVTDAANKKTGMTIYNTSDPNITYPMNIRQLVQSE